MKYKIIVFFTVMVYSYGSRQTMEQILEECNSSEARVGVVKKDNTINFITLQMNLLLFR